MKKIFLVEKVFHYHFRRVKTEQHPAANFCNGDSHNHHHKLIPHQQQQQQHISNGNGHCNGSTTTTITPVAGKWWKEKKITMLRLPIADRMVMRIADARDAVQIKTFTKWINKHTTKRGEFVTHLEKDLRDGRALISLIEILTGTKLPKERNSLRFHCVQNVNTVLEYLEHKQIKLVNIRAEDIVDGNVKITLALVWAIVLNFHIADVAYKATTLQIQQQHKLTDETTQTNGGGVGAPPTPITPQDAKAALLQWVQQLIQDYPVRVVDFSRSWRDGLAFCAILHCYCSRPGNAPHDNNYNNEASFDFASIQRYYSNAERLRFAFQLAEQRFGVVPLLDPGDVDTPVPDARSLMTYVSSLYDALVWQARAAAKDQREILAEQSKSRKHIMAEYLAQASALFQWMQTKVSELRLNDAQLPENESERQSMLDACRECKRVDLAVRNSQRVGLHELWLQLQHSLPGGGENSNRLSRTRVNLETSLAESQSNSSAFLRAEDLITPNLAPPHIDEMWQKFLQKLDTKEKKLVAWWSMKQADELQDDLLLSSAAAAAATANRRRRSSAAATQQKKTLEWSAPLPTADDKERMYAKNLQNLIIATTEAAASPALAKKNLSLPLKSSLTNGGSGGNGGESSSEYERKKQQREASRNNFFGLKPQHHADIRESHIINGSSEIDDITAEMLMLSPPKTNLEPSSLQAQLFTTNNHHGTNYTANGNHSSTTAIMSPPSPGQTGAATERTVPATKARETAHLVSEGVMENISEKKRNTTTARRPPRASQLNGAGGGAGGNRNSPTILNGGGGATRRSTSASQFSSPTFSKSSSVRSTSSGRRRSSANATSLPSTLARAVALGLYEPSDSTFYAVPAAMAAANDETREAITFEEAIKIGIVDASTLIVQDPRSNTSVILSMQQALDAHVVDRVRGDMVHPRTGQRLSLFDACSAAHGWIREGRSPFTLLAAVRAGLYSAKTNAFHQQHPLPHNNNSASLSPPTAARMRSASYTLAAAIDAGIIDARNSLVFDETTREKKFIPLSLAIENGCVDAHTARVRVLKGSSSSAAASAGAGVPAALTNGGDSNNSPSISLLQAVENGYITDVANDSSRRPSQQPPPTLGRIIEQGQYERNSGTGEFRLVVHGSSGSGAGGGQRTLLTLDEAVSHALVLAYAPTIRHPCYERRVLSLATALSIGLIDGERGVMKLPPASTKQLGRGGGAAAVEDARAVQQSSSTIDLVTAKERGYLLTSPPDNVHYV